VKDGERFQNLNTCRTTRQQCARHRLRFGAKILGPRYGQGVGANVEREGMWVWERVYVDGAAATDWRAHACAPMALTRRLLCGHVNSVVHLMRLHALAPVGSDGFAGTC